MKKLKLKAFELGATELLTREQLKGIVAGSGGNDCPNECQSEDDCPDGEICKSVPCPEDPTVEYLICAVPD